MTVENWRTAVDSSDYFGFQKKRVEIEQRRPAIRKASDLVGPGIGAEAVRLDDYNNLLATFNGYYSSAVGAANAPNSTEAFVGHVISDAEFGGRQIFTGLTSGTEYSRTFTRSPTDPESIGWGQWSGQRIPATAISFAVNTTSAPNNSMTILPPPSISTIGESGVYESSAAGIRIRKQGVYTGNIQILCPSGTTVTQVNIQRPDGLATVTDVSSGRVLAPEVYFPFTTWAADELQGFSVAVLQVSGSAKNYWWRFQCTRIGDAV